MGWARFRVKAKSGPNCAIVWSGLQIRSYQDDFSGSIVSLHCDDKKVAAHLVYLNNFFLNLDTEPELSNRRVGSGSIK